MNQIRLFFFTLLLALFFDAATAQERQRARELGINIGILTPGHYNAITDVEGVQVGHSTVVEGEDIRTGVTAILPHSGNLFHSRVPAAVFVGNGFGKALGFTQVQELGELETPIGLTNTLSIHTVANGIVNYMLNQEGNENVRSVNSVVGETNDGWLNDIRGRHITMDHVYEAIENAESGPVDEGNAGAGTGTRALGFKGGIGTASRVLPEKQGGYTVGVLVQSNFGGILTINGAPVGKELGNHFMSGDVPYEVAEIDSNYTRQTASSGQKGTIDGYDYDTDGSIMIIVATDAPVTSRNLERLAKRAFMGIARVGGFASNGSGDYVIAFSTSEDVRRDVSSRERTESFSELRNEATSSLFLAAVEATEEAIINSLFMAETMSGTEDRVQEALPIEEVLEILEKYGSLQ